MNTRTLLPTAAFLAVVAISILSAVASSVIRVEGVDGAPFGWHAQALESGNA